MGTHDIYPDDEPSGWLILIAVVTIIVSMAIIDLLSMQPDIGAEPRSDVIWSERELER